jgi:hypothetical protein
MSGTGRTSSKNPQPNKGSDYGSYDGSDEESDKKKSKPGDPKPKDIVLALCCSSTFTTYTEKYINRKNQEVERTMTQTKW